MAARWHPAKDARLPAREHLERPFLCGARPLKTAAGVYLSALRVGSRLIIVAGGEQRMAIGGCDGFGVRTQFVKLPIVVEFLQQGIAALNLGFILLPQGCHPPVVIPDLFCATALVDEVGFLQGFRPIDLCQLRGRYGWTYDLLQKPLKKWRCLAAVLAPRLPGLVAAPRACCAKAPARWNA